jgi:hypothetical protein
MTSLISTVRPTESELLEECGEEAGFAWAQRCLAHDADHSEVRDFAHFVERADAGRPLSRYPERDSSLRVELEKHGRDQVDLDGSDPWSYGFGEGVVAAWWCDAE